MGLVKKIASPLGSGVPVNPDPATDVIAPTRYGKPLSSYDLETDKRIHVSGIMQAVISSPAIAPFIFKQEDFSRVVEEETRKLLAVAQKLVNAPR